MEISKFKKIIERYYTGQASGQERFIIDCWYESLQEDSEAGYKKNTRRLSELQERIIVNAFGKSLRKQWYLRRATVAAAALLAAISVALILYAHRDQRKPQQTYTTVSSSIGQVKRVVLADSTEVFLNANSTLSIPSDFGLETRKIRLSGEAFFNVMRDTLKPFEIMASDLRVRVLGTSFNVSAYEQLPKVQVSVQTGLVQVSDSMKNLASLEANSQLTYYRPTASYTRTTFESADRFAWKDGIVVLDHADFDELNRAIFNQYGVTLKTEDNLVQTNAYNFVIRSSRKLEQTMDQLCAMVNKRYRKEGSNIIIY